MSKKSVFQEKITKKLPGDYIHTSMVSHRGTVVSFGMTTQGKIKYAVLDLSPGENKSEIDRECWTDISDLDFPKELSQFGYGVIKNYQMPLRDRNNEKVKEEDIKFKVQIDDFYSSTAKLTAKAPFQVISDGKYIYLFRQSLRGNDDKVDTVGDNIPVVNSALLVDRYVLSDTVLLLSREIRYQRSRHKTQPASKKDTLSAVDMDKNPFYEPTRELGFINNLSAGGFSVLLLPTQETEVKRWQIFYYDTKSEKVNSVSIKSDSDGWFDAADSKTFVEEFVEGRELGSSFIDTILEKIRNNATDGNIASDLKTTFKPKLDDLENEEIEEVVFTVRTGIVKDDFSIAGDYTVKTGLASIFYYQKEIDPNSGKPMKGNASVMLAMGLENLQQEEKNYLGVLSFAVSKEGRLSRLSKEAVALPELDLDSINQEDLLEEINNLEKTIASLREDIEEDRQEHIDGMSTVKEWEDRPEKTKRITNEMISSLYSREECIKYSANIESVNAAIDITKKRKETFENAYKELDDSEPRQRRIIAQATYYALDSEHAYIDGVPYTLRLQASEDSMLPCSAVVNHPTISGVRFFFRGDRYWKFNKKTGIESGYPKKIKDMWCGIPDNIDAAVNHPSIKDKFFFFTKAEYWRYTFNKGVDPGYPKDLSDDWDGLPVYIDAVVNHPKTPNKFYFFANEEYWKYTFNEGIDSGYPKAIKDEWDKIPDYLNAAVNVSNTSEQFFFFKGDQYWKHTWNKGLVSGYPKKIVDMWTGFTDNTVEIDWDDRPTLQKLIKLEEDILHFYEDLIKPKLIELNLKEIELNEKKEGVKTGVSSVKMPVIEVDRDGLACSGGLLKFAYTADKPFLFDDSLGRVALYFRGENQNFFSAYFNPNVTQSIEPQGQDELSFKPRLPIDMNLGLNTVATGNSVQLTITNKGWSNKVLEEWNYLPKSSKSAGAILNGNGHFKLGYLSHDHEASESTLTINCLANNEFIPTQVNDISSGTEKRLSMPEFLEGNRTLYLGNKRFSINRSYVYVKAVKLEKREIAGAVTEEEHIETVWSHLENKGLIDNTGVFINGNVFEEDGDKVIRSALEDLPKEVKYAGKNLFELIKNAALKRDIRFYIDHSNEAAGDTFGAGLEVQVAYDYQSNYKCYPENLTGISLHQWEHHRSFLFHVDSNSDIDLTELNQKSYAIKKSVGQWEAYGPGLAISFNRALERVDGRNEVGLLTTKDNLAELQPTTKGLTMEAWIYPREIVPLQDSSSIICYKNDEKKYSLEIRKDGSRYNCFATVEDKTIKVAGSHEFESWRHLAVAYKKYWGVKLDKSAIINCGNDVSLSLDGEFAIEWLGTIEASDCVLLSKKDEYSIEVIDNRIAFILGGADVLALNGLSVQPNKFHKITVIRSKAKPQDINSKKYYPETGDVNRDGCVNGEKWYKGKPTDKIIEGMAEQQDKMMQNPQFAQSDMLDLSGDNDQNSDDQYYYSLIIGEQSYSSIQQEIDPPESRFSDLYIGDTDSEGVMAEARIWNRALSMEEAKRSEVAENKNSLLSWWRMDEGEGKFLHDDAGMNHGVIEDSGYEWVDSPDTDLQRFKFYIDGRQQDYHAVEGSEGTTTNQFSIGGFKQGDQINGHFDGTLEEVRIWGVSRSAEEIIDNAMGRLKGEREKLLANYTFDTDFSEAKKAELYDIDGVTQSQVHQIWGQAFENNEITSDGIVIDEAKLKETVKTKLKVSSVNNTLVKQVIAVFKSPAEIDDLSYNDATLKVEGHIWDGNAEKENIAQILSTAPVADEIPVVRSALSGVKTDYNDNISSCPAVVEYGDIQEDEHDGVMNGILKRCYSFIKDGQWRLTTGYKVGNLVTEWYSQAQFDPQIIGFLEGAPPVPGENFPITKDSDIDIYAYKLDNSVSLEESEEVSYNFSTSKEAGYQVSAESEASLGFGLSFIIAPFGFGIEQAAEIGGKFTTHWDTSGNRSQSFERGVTINTDRTLSATLAGYDNGKTGGDRYYKLGNTGYALVKSKTADIYLLRLEHNNALVSICWRPNPDIPEDTNIISFPINPLYVKQGTLDGKFGETSDDHYPLARGAYGEYSYFKPKEAYRLKRKIEKERLALESYYQNFKTSKTSDKMKAAIASTGLWQLTNLVVGYGPVVNSALNQTIGHVSNQLIYNDTKLQDEISKSMSQRNLANTYVWTVEGGFFAESTQVAETQQEVYSNDYSLSLGGNMGITYKAEAGAKLEQEALFGSGSSLTLTKTKTKEAGKSFGLDVSVDIPTSPRYKYDGRTMTKGLISPGVVDAYRFMSFYLEPQAENYNALFTRVIDPKWLDESPDPNARALRQARNDIKKPFCWRIMHRVTFVSRILPEFRPEDPDSMEKRMRAQNIESNYMLIKLFEPYVGYITDREKFFQEVDRVIDSQLPEFVEYKKEIKAYLELYFDIY